MREAPPPLVIGHWSLPGLFAKTFANHPGQEVPMPQTALNPVHANERAERLAALYEIVQAVASSMEPDRLLGLIVERACDLLRVERCGLFLVETPHP
jgi:hypothetical protein